MALSGSSQAGRLATRLQGGGVLGMVLLSLGVAGVFHPVWQADFVNWDDDFHVIENRKVQDPGAVGLREWLLTPELGYPVPVTMASYALERWLHGPSPEGFHGGNLLLHLLHLWLLWGIARRLGVGEGWALVGAAWFGLHPVVVEPVAWVSGRKDLLAATFLLVAGWWLAGLRQRGDDRVGPRWGIAGLLVLAMLAKPVAALGPAVAWTLDSRGRRGPWPVAMVATLGLAGLAFVLEARVGALEGGGASGGALVRVLAGAAWHGRNLLFPMDLMPKYLDPPEGPGLPMLAGGAVLVLGGLGLLVLAFRRCPRAIPGLALAVATYGPVAGVVPLSRQYADSYLYLPLAGLALAVAAGGSRLSRGIDSQPLRKVLVVAGLGLALLAGIRSADQVDIWQDGVHLWATVWQRYPDSPQVCRNLGNAHLFGRRYEPGKAAAVYRHCIDRLGQREFFLKNLAIATALAGDLEAARPLVQEALQARPDDPVLRRWAERLGRVETPSLGREVPEPVGP
ncbi:MAG TPA: hypothetical protein PLQ97_11640 [Myxococcota bacterium]|nr:hypothetical protein [Myxococcota bacterium]HQK51740.1 hypothetical protein [Myxococcota bacterium]